MKNLDESPPEDIAVFVNEENFSNITADIEGPCTHFFCLLIFPCPIFCLCDNEIELPDSIHQFVTWVVEIGDMNLCKCY